MIAEKHKIDNSYPGDGLDKIYLKNMICNPNTSLSIILSCLFFVEHIQTCNILIVITL